MSLTRVVWYAIKIFEGKINETSCKMTVPATTALTSDFISMAEDDEEREEVLTLVSFKAKLCPNGCNMCHHFRGDCTFWWRGFAAQLTSACHLAVYCLWNNLFGSVQYGSDNSSLAEWVSLSAPTCSASGVHRPLRMSILHFARGSVFVSSSCEPANIACNVLKWQQWLHKWFDNIHIVIEIDMTCQQLVTVTVLTLPWLTLLSLSQSLHLFMNICYFFQFVYF